MKNKQANNTVEGFVGVDTHKEFHVAVIINQLGQRLGDKTVDANAKGYRLLLAWALEFCSKVAFGIEGTGSYGKGLTDHLTNSGYGVFEVDRPERLGRRIDGKTDTIDAERAARALLAGQVTTQPKCLTDTQETLRNLVNTRDALVKATVGMGNIAHGLIVTAPEEIRERFRGLKGKPMMKQISLLRPTDSSHALFGIKQSLKSLADAYLQMTKQADALEKDINDIVNEKASELIDLKGVGPIVASILLVSFGSDPNRLKNDAAFAKLTGTCPLPASSGKTIRYRLNRSGDRQANRALHIIALCRLRTYQPSIDYKVRRLAEGKTMKEIIRCQKRYIAREVYGVIKEIVKNNLQTAT